MKASRLEREAEYHDQRFSEQERAADRFYAITASSKGLYHRWIMETASNPGHMLEYGCGDGGFSFDLAQIDKSVHAIDLSKKGVLVAREKAIVRGLSKNIAFSVMDAQRLAYSDREFDLVFGSGILHHLNLKAALAEIARVLKPDGTGVFFEPLGHNVFINLYRRLTPHMRSVDERPLKVKDFELFCQYFKKLEVRFFHFFSLIAMPFRTTRLLEPIVRVLDTLDQALFTIPCLRKQAWVAVIRLTGPNSNTLGSAQMNPQVHDAPPRFA